ncbi:unnamed protein product, partial [Meganyctiphanes norvegica]
RCSIKPIGGVYRMDIGLQIFYLHREPGSERNWNGANFTCVVTEEMRLAEPNDIPGLKDFILTNIDRLDKHYWVGGRGDGQVMAWLSSGDEVYPAPNNPPVWQAGHPTAVDTANCLDFRPMQTPGQLATGRCRTVHPFICECL